MARLAGSFLIRIWRTNHSQRFAIEHIQSGEKAVTTSATEAIDWVSARSDAETDDEHGATESSAGDELDRRYQGSGV